MKWIIPCVLAIGLLTGCGSATGKFVSAPSPSETQSETDNPADETGEPDDAPDACFDGNCEITVTDETEIALDPQFGLDTLTLTVADDALTVTGTSADGLLLQSHIGGSGTATLNGIVINVDDIAGDTADLRLSTQ